MDISELHRKAAASEGWLQKAAEEADLIVDGEDDSDEEFYQVKSYPCCPKIDPLIFPRVSCKARQGQV